MRTSGSFHNLGTVFRFEVVRTLKKKSFWIMSLMFPVMFAAIAGIIFFSNKTTGDAADKMKDEQFSTAITDESGLIDKSLVTSLKMTERSDKQQAIDDVKNGKLDAYFYFPQDLSKGKVETYGKDVGLFNNGRYSGVATMLLEQSVTNKVASNVKTVLQDTTQFSNVTYKDGAPYDGFKEMIAPGIFLVLFYIVIAMFGGQMLTSTTEEKENRIIEVILTTIESRTLIVGKILSLIVLGIVQVCIIMIPVVVGYVLLHDKLSLPSIDLSNLPLDPGHIIVGALIFIVSFLLFTGLLVTIGAAIPTAKEASGFFGVIMMLIFGPLYAAPLFISSPESPLVQVLSYFPLTAPIPLMLRNAVGTLSYTEAAIAIAILAVTAVVILNIAVRVFRYGALEYSRRLSLREIFVKQ